VSSSVGFQWSNSHCFVTSRSGKSRVHKWEKSRIQQLGRDNRYQMPEEQERLPYKPRLQPHTRLVRLDRYSIRHQAWPTADLARERRTGWTPMVARRFAWRIRLRANTLIDFGGLWVVIS
jgi:hypothetical protein